MGRTDSPAVKAMTRMLRKEQTLRKRGFTLVEMSVVITLLALFATMVVPAMAHWRAGDEYRAFPGKLMRFLADAKLSATQNHASRSISYDETTSEFRMFWTDPETAQEQEGGRVALPSGIEVGRLTYANTDSSPQDWRLTFYQDGSADKSAMELRDQDDYISVTVDDTGTAKMTRDALPEPGTERWNAGENEVRQ
jgi:prepilin-type N-terminal cleavage/methylation domain-containing protein